MTEKSSVFGRARAYLGHENDSLVLTLRVQLLTAGVFQVGHIARKLDDGQLHSQADAEEGNLLGASIVDGPDHSFGASLAETSGDQDTIGGAHFMPGLVVGRQRFLLGSLLQVGSINPNHLELLLAVHGRVFQRLAHAQVGIVQGGVLPDESDRGGLVDVVLAGSKVHPFLPDVFALLHQTIRPGKVVQMQKAADGAQHLLLLQQ